MGNHRSVRAGSGQRRGLRRAASVGVGVCLGFATFAGIGLASGTSTPSVYSAITPVTVLGRSLAAHSTTDVTVAGVGSVPSNATSVQLSVTALDGTATSSMYVYATGATQPASANVRWETGETVTIPVTVAVGTAGKIRLTTDGGTVTIKVSVVGYFTEASGGAGYAVQNLASVPIAAAVVGESGTNIESIALPAGSYEIHGKATLALTGGSTDTVTCILVDEIDEEFDTTSVALDTGIDEAVVSLTGLAKLEGGTVWMQCSGSGSNANAEGIDLVAIQLSSATGFTGL